MSWRDRIAEVFSPRQDTARQLIHAEPTAPASVRLLAQVVNRIDSLVNTMTGLGTAADKGQAGRPNTLRTRLTIEELTALWRWNGYARRYVALWPQAATRKGWRVVDDTQTVDLMEAEDKRLNVVERVRDAATWARKDGGALVLLVTTEKIPPAYSSNPQAYLAEPLDLDRLISVDNLIVLDRSEASVWSYDGDPRSQNYRQPLIWQVSPSSPVGNDALFCSRVHHTRVLYFPGAKLPPSVKTNVGDGYDDSAIESVWDQIRGLTSSDQAAYTMAQEVQQDVLKIAGLAALETGDQQALFDLRMKTLAQSKGLLNMILLDESDQFETRTNAVTGWKDLKDHAREALAAVEATPQTILYGESPGGLNTDGESGHRSFSEEIAAYQHAVLKPRLVDLYRALFRAKEGPTKGKEPTWWDVVFNALDELSTMDQVKAEGEQVKADALRVEVLGMDPAHVLKSRHGEKGYQWDLLPVEGVEEIDTAIDVDAMDEAAAEAEAQAAAARDEQAAADEQEADADGGE